MKNFIWLAVTLVLYTGWFCTIFVTFVIIVNSLCKFPNLPIGNQGTFDEESAAGIVWYSRTCLCHCLQELSLRKGNESDVV
jgi:hypothetical protein